MQFALRNLMSKSRPILQAPVVIPFVSTHYDILSCAMAARVR